MSNIKEKFSGLVLVIIVAITTISYVCTMNIIEENAQKITTSLCQDMAAAVDSNVGRQISCLATHLAVTKKFLSILPQTTILLAVILLTGIIYQTSLYKFLLIIHQSLFRRWRHFFHRYRTWIKLLLEARLLKYLNLQGNFIVASL
jgi:hypothetical protein